MSLVAMEPKKAESAPRPAQKFTLRCIAYQQGRNLFVAECVDLDLIVKGKSMKQAVSSLQEAIHGYLMVAFESGDLKGLVPRRSRWTRRFLYHWAGLQCRLGNLIQRAPRQGLPKRFIVSDQDYQAFAC